MTRIAPVVFAVLLSGCVSASESTSPSTTRPLAATTPVATTTTTTTALPATTVDQVANCLARAEFGDPALSEYILPYRSGEDYYLSQSYCSAGSHHNQLAYDFNMPIGTEVLAARAGRVKGVRDSSPDNGVGDGDHNYVFIQHDDGTVAFYAHLMQDGVVVEPGDEVNQGDLIAYSGNSGQTGGNPHLHFGVYLDWLPQEGRDTPVNFSNAAGELDARGGLAVGVRYEAE